MSEMAKTTAHADPRTIRPAAQLRDGRWVVRRALLGLTLIALTTCGAALLYHVGIEADAAATVGSAE